MKRFIFSALAVGALVSIISCEKAQIQKQDSEAMKFNASYNGEVSTKAEIAFPVGNKATIIGYSAGATISTATPVAGTPLEATGAAGGALTASALYLIKGFYDFYSVSVNSSSPAGITFSSGLSAQLVNSTDYLWAKAAGVAQGGTATLSFSHKAVAMEINVAAGSGVSNLTVMGIRFTPTKSDASSRMAIASGAIGAAAAKNNLTDMILSESKGTYIMLPSASLSLDVEITINGTIGGTNVLEKMYTAAIPAQIYSGGTYYTLNLTISATSMTFSGATVQDWTNQTISGISLTEI